MVGTSIEFDAVLELCRDQHRRIVLAVLADQQRAVTVDECAEAIGKHNHQTQITELSGDVVAEIELSLRHVHFPKLAEAGVVDHDPERRRVAPTDRFDQLQPELSAILEADPVLEPPIEP